MVKAALRKSRSPESIFSKATEAGWQEPEASKRMLARGFFCSSCGALISSSRRSSDLYAKKPTAIAVVLEEHNGNTGSGWVWSGTNGLSRPAALKLRAKPVSKGWVSCLERSMQLSAVALTA